VKSGFVSCPAHILSFGTSKIRTDALVGMDILRVEAVSGYLLD
jgi:hypothetical protein